MNFFEQIAALQLTGALKIVIQQTSDNLYSVSTLLNNEKCGDDARKLITPFTLTGTSEQLDEAFFTTISTPLKKTSELMDNMEGYLKTVEEARKHSAMEKEKTEQEKKEKETKKKKYEEIMKKAKELEDEGKYREAYVRVPEADIYPEFAEQLRKKREELVKKFEPNLFNG